MKRCVSIKYTFLGIRSFEIQSFANRLFLDNLGTSSFHNTAKFVLFVFTLFTTPFDFLNFVCKKFILHKSSECSTSVSFLLHSNRIKISALSYLAKYFISFYTHILFHININTYLECMYFI